MAQQGPKGASKKLSRDRITEALVPDPTKPPRDSIAIHGYVGNSTDPSNLRLYLTPDMRTYVEIPEAEVLHSQQLPDDQGTLVWVPATLNLAHHSTQSAEVQAQFLQGDMASHVPGGLTPGMVPPHGPVPTPPYTIFFCPPHTHLPPCFTQLIPCHVPTSPVICFHSQVIPCPPPTVPYICFHSQFIQCPHPTAPNICFQSQVLICYSRICPSVAIPCQSVPFCPSVACPSGFACGPGGGGPLGGGQ